MIRLSSYLFCLIPVLFLYCHAFPFAEECQWRGIGPEGGYITSLAADPFDPLTLYAGMLGGGVFKSMNGGKDWSVTNSGLGNSYVRSLSIDPSNPKIIYAGTSEGIFKSTSAGASWFSAGSGLSAGMINSIAIDPTTPLNIYAAVSYSGIFKSADGGLSWKPVNVGLRADYSGSIFIKTLAIDPKTPQNVYAAYTYGVYKSTNGGATWNAANSGFPIPYTSVDSLIVDPSAPQTLYASSSYGLYKSTGGGDNWIKTNDDTIRRPIECLAIAPKQQLLFVGTYRGIYRSSDGGGSFSLISVGPINNSSVDALIIGSDNTLTLFAGVSYMGVYKSVNGGLDWSGSSANLSSIAVRSLAIDPGANGTIYVGSDEIMFKTTDGGRGWKMLNPGSIQISSIVINPSSPQTIYVAQYSGVAKSTDGGGKWLPASTGLPQCVRMTCPGSSSLVMDPAKRETLYGVTGGSVYKTTTGASVWIASNSGITSHVNTIAIDPFETRTLYAGTTNGILKSTDEGANWIAAKEGLGNVEVTALAIDPITPQKIYAGTRGAGIFKSTNRGGSWNSVNNNLSDMGITALAVDPRTPDVIYAATKNGGVFMSTNGGSDWQAMNTGLAAKPNAAALAIDPANPRTLYAGTDGGGVWAYCKCSAPGQPILYSPAGDAGSNPTFTWSSVSGAEQYMLWVDDADAKGKIQKWYSATQAGCSSGTGKCSITPGIPLSSGAGTWWVQAWNSCNGGSYGSWSGPMKFNVIAGCQAPERPSLIAPVGTASSNPTYVWRPAGGAEWYMLWVDDSSAGGKIRQWYTSAQAGCAGSAVQCSVAPSTSLAAGAGTWWIQAWNSCNGGSYSLWSEGASFTVKNAGSGLAEITNPAPLSRLSSTVVPFFWTAGTEAIQYWLYIGTTPGGKELYNENQNLNLSALVQGLPNDGSTIYARLWTLKREGWAYRDYSYLSCSGCGSSLAAIISPIPGSTLTATTVTFEWSAGTGVSRYWLSVGRSIGSHDIYHSDMQNRLTATITNLPSDGSTIYVRLWSEIAGYWAHNDYDYRCPATKPKVGTLSIF